MQHSEHGRACRADQPTNSNRQPNRREDGIPFSAARAAAVRVMTAEAVRNAVFLEGGLVPWLVSGRDSGRLHGDVDFSVRIDDMPAVRGWLSREGLYDRALDSIDLPCNSSRADFGVHAIIDGVPVSFCPFAFEGGKLRQRNAAVERLEGFDALFEARIPGLEEEDFVEVRDLPGVGPAGVATLEACLAAKSKTARPKDAADMEEMARIGYDAARLERAEAAFSRMSVKCVAYENPKAAAASECSHWAKGVLRAAEGMSPGERTRLFGSCAEACIEGRGLLTSFEELQAKARGDLDAFFELLGEAPGVSTEKAEGEGAWAMSYDSCTCPLVASGIVQDPALCECSRQSVLFVLGRLFPGTEFHVSLEKSVLCGSRQCMFRIKALES